MLNVLSLVERQSIQILGQSIVRVKRNFFWVVTAACLAYKETVRGYRLVWHKSTETWRGGRRLLITVARGRCAATCVSWRIVGPRRRKVPRLSKCHSEGKEDDEEPMKLLLLEKVARSSQEWQYKDTVATWKRKGLQETSISRRMVDTTTPRKEAVLVVARNRESALLGYSAPEGSPGPFESF